MPATGRVAIVTLGCGRNDVDSDQVGGALVAAGHELVDDPAAADCVLVNTCTFVEAARAESIESILAAADPPDRRGAPAPVLVMGCMAERYRDTLAAELPEAAGVIGFGDYPALPAIVAAACSGADDPVTAGRARGSASSPRRATRVELPLTTVPAPDSAPVAPAAPPTVGFPVRTVPRGPWAYLKLAGGCDRACTFCTIPSYRGTFASRPVAEVLAEARWLVDQGVAELVCVSENTTSYGKDLPGGRDALHELIAGFEALDGLERVRLLYLQPDELRQTTLEAMAASRVVAPYYDLSLQHASEPVLRRMARSGDPDRFLALIEGIRARDPAAVVRSSFITGFPGETDDDVAVLRDFLDAAEVDWPGFFTYSREDGTASAAMPDQVPADEAAARRDELAALADLAAEERARGFVGADLRVLVEEVDAGVVGRSHREGPESDGEVRVAGGIGVTVGDVLDVRVVAAEGVDLIAEPASARGGRTAPRAAAASGWAAEMVAGDR